MGIILWTDEMDATLKKYYDMGWSSRMIGAELGKPRNAVIGRAFRLRNAGILGPRPVVLPDRNVEVTFADGVRTIKPRRLKPSVIALKCAEIEPRHVSLVDLERCDCRYPYGDGPFTFCGHERREGSSYCDAHYDLTRYVNRSDNFGRFANYIIDKAAA